MSKPLIASQDKQGVISIAFSPRDMWPFNSLLSFFFCDTWRDMWHDVICLAIVTILQCKYSIKNTDRFLNITCIFRMLLSHCNAMLHLVVKVVLILAAKDFFGQLIVSHYRPCDIFSTGLFFYISRNYSFIYTWLVENVSWIPRCIITWCHNPPKLKGLFWPRGCYIYSSVHVHTVFMYVCMYIHFMHFALKLTAIEKASFVNVVKCSASGAQYMNLAAFFVIDLIYM